MNITNLNQVKAEEMMMEGAKKVLKQIPISKSDGTPNFSFRVFTLLPGGHTPYHVHPFEHLNYVIEGEGTVVTESGEERPIGKGDFVLVMPAERHQYRNRSAQNSLSIICAVPKEYE
jgi:quercetin dioxygenase-like cupin family protein